MANEKLDELEQKKKELEEELGRIQDELDDSIDQVRSDVSSKLDPVNFVKRHPLPVVGFSVLVGFLAGHNRRKSDSGSESGRDSSSMLWSELKRLATKKAISLASDYVEQLLVNTKGRISPSSSTENDSSSKDS